jgi:EmrB/QacA subfamily drug resistance transporter
MAPGARLATMTQDEQTETGPVDEETYVPDPRRWRILAVSLVVGFMSLLDVTIVNVAVPSIRAGLGTSAATIQWVVSGYALAFGMTLVAGGRLGDAHGRRRMMTIGLIGFVVSSAAVGLAPNAAAIVLARLAQGASAGLLTPQNSGLVQQLFRGEERGRAFGMFGFTVAIASATGPLIGGALIGLLGEENGWRSLFLVNVPIGLVALVMIRRLVPDNDAGSADVERDPRVDLPGALLLGLAVLAVLYPLISLEGGAGLPLLLLLAFPPLAWAFVRWEVRTVRLGRPPLLDVSLLRGLPGYANGLLVGTLYFTGFTGIFLVLSVHLQEGEGFSPLRSALLLTPFAAGAALTSPLAGRLVGRIGRRVTLVALSVMITGTALAAWLVTSPSDALWWTLAPAMFLAGIGGGGVISPNFTLTLAEVPPRMGGAAGGALQTGQRIGSALGAALLMTVYQAVGSVASAPVAARSALLAALAVLLVALAAAVRSWRVGD